MSTDFCGDHNYQPRKIPKYFSSEPIWYQARINRLTASALRSEVGELLHYYALLNKRKLTSNAIKWLLVLEDARLR
jgi:hypothetical protein